MCSSKKVIQGPFYCPLFSNYRIQIGELRIPLKYMKGLINYFFCFCPIQNLSCTREQDKDLSNRGRDN